MTPTDGVADRVGKAIGGSVTSRRRLSGGASRTTSALDLERPDGTVLALVLQRQRGDGLAPGAGVTMEAALLRAARSAGVPVPQVVAAGEIDGLEPGWLVVERLEGESIPRRLLRDQDFASARASLTGEVARALAGIHGVPPDRIPGLPSADPLERPLPFLDGTGEVRPVLEVAARWQEAHRPEPTGRTVVHGDYRMGNFLVDADGLRGVLDWELAHAGDPAEDIGWLTAPAWRFGGDGEVGGFGRLEPFLAEYAAAGGRVVEPATVRWWQAYATLKWAVICALQASVHLSGATRSVELAAIGRRVCESEADLLALMGVPLAPAGGGGEEAPVAPAPFGRPGARELVEAVQGYLEDRVMASAEGAARFEARVARNALGVVARELALGPAIRAAHRGRLERLGFADDAALASAVRAGDLDGDLVAVADELAGSVRDQLRVANPGHPGLGP